MERGAGLLLMAMSFLQASAAQQATPTPTCWPSARLIAKGRATFPPEFALPHDFGYAW